MKEKRTASVSIDGGNFKIFMGGLAAMAVGIGTAVAIWQLSAALAIGIGLLSGSAGAAMVIRESCRGAAGIIMARANAKRIEDEGKAAVISARNYPRLEAHNE